MSVGVPYMFSNDSYYKELAGDSGIYYKDGDEFLSTVNEILDNKHLRDSWSEKSFKRFKQGKW